MPPSLPPPSSRSLTPATPAISCLSFLPSFQAHFEPQKGKKKKSVMKQARRVLPLPERTYNTAPPAAQCLCHLVLSFFPGFSFFLPYPAALLACRPIGALKPTLALSLSLSLPSLCQLCVATFFPREARREGEKWGGSAPQFPTGIK